MTKRDLRLHGIISIIPISIIYYAQTIGVIIQNSILVKNYFHQSIFHWSTVIVAGCSGSRRLSNFSSNEWM